MEARVHKVEAGDVLVMKNYKGETFVYRIYEVGDPNDPAAVILRPDRIPVTEWKGHLLEQVGESEIAFDGENSSTYRCVLCGEEFPGDYNRETGEVAAVYGCDPCEKKV